MEKLKREYEQHLEDLEAEGVIFKHIEYEYKGKNRSFDLTIIPHIQIATVAEAIPNDEGNMDLEILKESDLDYDAVCHYFPPIPAMKQRGYEYNMLGIFRSILYEMYQSLDNNDYGYVKEEGNVRGVWYSHFIKIVESVLGLGETASVNNAINKAWEDMIVSGLFTYDDVKILSAKENVKESHVRDSPFSNIIIAVEKEDLFDKLRWIPKLFNCTLIAAGGQPSRAVARVFIRNLLDEGVDLDQQFYMCTVSDCDPAGYYIQDSFRHQLEKAIEYYGGYGKIEIHRLFVRKDQVTPNLLQYGAVPCRDTHATTAAAIKAESTKWDYFCSITKGGLYKTPPAIWDGPTYYIARSCPICGHEAPTISTSIDYQCPQCETITPVGEMSGEIKCRAKLELNEFKKSVLELKILQEILNLIEDHSKIMIPEIMRVFNQLKKAVALARYEQLEESQIDPIIDKYLEDIDDLYYTYWNEIRDAKQEAKDKYEDDIEDTKIQFENDVGDIRDDIDDKVRPEMGVYCTLNDLIEKLEAMKEYVEDNMFDMVDSELDDIVDLEDKYATDIEPFKKERNEELKRLNDMKHMYEEEKDKFRNECATVFGPAKEQLKDKVLTTYKEQVDVRFHEVETDERTQPHIAKLLTDPGDLVDYGRTCFDHAVPAFKDETSLKEAAEAKEKNISKFRDAFTPEFEGDMQEIIREKAKDIEFKVKEELLDVAEIDEDKMDEFDEETREKIEKEHGEL